MEEETHTQILSQFNAYVEENQKFVEKGNKAAATRARKALLTIKKLAQSRRVEILEEKKSA